MTTWHSPSLKARSHRTDVSQGSPLVTYPVIPKRSCDFRYYHHKMKLLAGIEVGPECFCLPAVCTHCVHVCRVYTSYLRARCMHPNTWLRWCTDMGRKSHRHGLPGTSPGLLSSTAMRGNPPRAHALCMTSDARSRRSFNGDAFLLHFQEEIQMRTSWIQTGPVVRRRAHHQGPLDGRPRLEMKIHENENDFWPTLGKISAGHRQYYHCANYNEVRCAHSVLAFPEWYWLDEEVNKQWR